MNLSGVIGLVRGVVGDVINLVSPEIRTEVVSFVTNLHNKAVASKNTWDVFLTTMLMDVLGIPKN